ncbi:protein kinase [Purpureocillium lavendulum]|uniref:Protein kinase n=1 Tax=Purpureocillium lavendulum TaxID=1247861 RepID=A0AB34FF55_9HYPO|nr:protein kinase [Purpureocillium lavendulum]
MRDSEATTATVSVDDIAALSDEQLAQFMQKHRSHSGDFDLPVDGWDELSMHARNQLAERLKAQERILSQNPAVHSRALDLDQLDARLRQVSDGDDIIPQVQQRIQGRITPPYSQEDERRDRIDNETEAYNDLVKDGGRPIYRISLIEQVSRNPEEYREMLWPFWGYSRDTQVSWLVFRRQLKRWREFRKWQIDNRGLEDEDAGFPAFVEMMKRIYKKDKYDEGVAQLETDPSWLKSVWLDKQRTRRWQRRWQRERDCNGFSDYVDAVTRRLARHGFTRPFQLQEDPKQQDELTTWIEYLGFEYWWLDRYTDSIERLKPDHDRRWQELVDKKIPKPHETKDFIRTTPSSMERGREREQAREAKQMAEADAKRVYFLTQKDSRRLTIPKEKRMQMLEAAREKLVAAQERYEFTRRRVSMVTDFIRATFDYANAKKDATGHATLVQWVLEQVLLVEADPIQPNMTAASPDTKNKKRKRAQDENKPEKRSSKKQKPSHGEFPSSYYVRQELYGSRRGSERTTEAGRVYALASIHGCLSGAHPKTASQRKDRSTTAQFAADSRRYAFGRFATKITTKDSPKY